MSNERHAEVLCLLERGCDAGFSEASDNERLLTLLRDDDALMPLAQSVMRDAGLAQALFSDESRTAGLVLAQIRQQRPGQHLSAARRVTSHLRQTRHDSRMRWQWGIAAAAAAVLLVSGAWALHQHTPNVGSLTHADGSRLALQPDIQATLREPAVLRWPGEATALRIAADSTLTSHSGPAKRLTLAHGQIEAEVAPQPVGQPLRIATPQGQVEVVGTRFSLDVRDHATLLSVSSGTVAFHGNAAHPGMPVSGGAAAYAGADGAILLLPPETMHIDCAQESPRASWFGLPTATGLAGAPHPDGPTWRMVASPESGPLVRLHPRMRVTMDITLTQSCPVGILLLLMTPEGRFLENRQVMKTLAVGHHHLDLPLEQFERRTPDYPDKPLGILVQRVFISSYAPLDSPSLDVHQLTITTDP